MYTAQCVLWLIVLYVGCTHSWDIAVTHGDQLEFYTNDIKTHTARFNSHKLAALTYDEVHDMLLYVDKESGNDIICGYDLSSEVNQCFIERNGRNIHGLTFDPVTELVFFSDRNERSINWISLKSKSKNGNLLIKMDHGIPTDVAVDSCKGYVYWINLKLKTPTIERAQFNGSEMEVVINVSSYSINTTYKLAPHSLTIDQQTQRMYWIEPTSTTDATIYYAHMNVNVFTRTRLNSVVNSQTMLFNPLTNILTVSNTNLFFVHLCYDCEAYVWQLSKIQCTDLESVNLHAQEFTIGIAANYKIKERIQDLSDCKAPTTPLQKIPEVPFSVHGEKVTGQSLCKCTPGYISERCEVSECKNYCLQGNCSVNDEGLPTCRCNAGYSGKRCEVDVCHGYCSNNGDCSLNEKGEPICQCEGDPAGARCEVLDCVNYCIQGNCSINDDGLPQCRCNAGYSGERCEVATCHGYCLNYGVCALNEEDEPSCECVDGYEGSRCETVQYDTSTSTSTPTYSVGKTLTLADLLAKWRKPKILLIVDDY